MDLIRLAVEKSRTETERKSTADDAPPAVRSASRAPYRRSDISDSIVYTKTKVVSLDPGHLKRHRIIARDRSDPRTNAFDMLRTHLLQAMSANEWRTVAVTAPTKECGKSTVAINLAWSIARQKTPTVLLVDFNLGQPKIDKYLGLRARAGLSAYLEGRVKLDDILVNPGTSGLVVLPNERPCEHAADALGTVKVQNLVAELKTRYEERVVLFDIPPLLNGDNALAFLPNVDCVLLVVANGKTSKTELEQSLRLLEQKSIAGVILNEPCASRIY